MAEVRIRKLLYIRDIPAELLKKAVEAGELRCGKTVGLAVQPESGGEALIELRLSEEGQEGLVREGQVVPVEQAGSVYVLDSSWTVYLEKENERADSRRKAVEGAVTAAASRAL